MRWRARAIKAGAGRRGNGVVPSRELRPCKYSCGAAIAVRSLTCKRHQPPQWSDASAGRN